MNELRIPKNSMDLNDLAEIKSAGITFGCEAKHMLSFDEECENTCVSGFYFVNLSHLGFKLVKLFIRILNLPIMRKLTSPKHFTEDPIIEINKVASSRIKNQGLQGKVK